MLQMKILWKKVIGLKLQNVPSLDLPQQIANTDQADLRAQFA